MQRFPETPHAKSSIRLEIYILSCLLTSANRDSTAAGSFSYGKSSMRLPSLFFPWDRVSVSDLHHQMDRMYWSLRHRCARSGRRRIEISRLGLQPRLSHRYMFHHTQHRVPPMHSIEWNSVSLHAQRTQYAPSVSPRSSL